MIPEQVGLLRDAGALILAGAAAPLQFQPNLHKREELDQNLQNLEHQLKNAHSLIPPSGSGCKGAPEDTGAECSISCPAKTIRVSSGPGNSP